MWLPLGVGNVVCVNGVVYVWSDLFQSVLSPPFSGMLLKTGSLHPWLGCGHVKSSQVTFIYIALLTIQIVTKHCTI